MALRSGTELSFPVELAADVVVVGTGAGGGMLLHDAAAAGLRVLAFEEGEHRDSSSFRGQERAQLAALYQDGGGRTTDDGAVTVLQGRGVGGSTVHNTNLCRRVPDPILRDWSERLGLDGWRPDRVAADFAAVEALLHVSAIEPERVNRNNGALLRGMAALGWRGGLLSHNRRGCAGSGLCELGCPFDAKENVLKALLPAALAHGATVWSGVRVERVLVEGGRAVGVVGRASGPQGRPGPTVTARARAVVLAGSAVGSAVLALSSGLPDPHHLVGGNLHLHPGAAVAGYFDEPIEGWSGIPQSVECTEHIDWWPGSPRRIWIVPAFAHPIGIAAATPGFGAAHMQALRRYPFMAVLVAMLHDESAGRVTATRGRPSIAYQLNEADRRALSQGMAACARLLLAAGAREVMAPTRPPLRITADSQLGALADHAVRAFDPPLTAVHPMGTLPMAADPARGVCDGRGRYHGVPGLYVADGSLLPTSIGVPPQIAIYTAGRRTAATVLADLRGG